MVELQQQPLVITENYLADHKTPNIDRAPRGIDLGLHCYQLLVFIRWFVACFFLLADLDNDDDRINKCARTTTLMSLIILLLILLCIE